MVSVLVLVLIILVIIAVIVFLTKWRKTEVPVEENIGGPVQDTDKDTAVVLRSRSPPSNAQRETDRVRSPPNNVQDILSEIHLPPENSRMSIIEKSMHDLPDIPLPDILNHLNNIETSNLQNHDGSTRTSVYV